MWECVLFLTEEVDLLEVEFSHDYQDLFHCVAEVGLGLQALSQDRQEVVDSSRVQLSVDGSDSDGLLVDHLHDLPL